MIPARFQTATAVATLFLALAAAPGAAQITYASDEGNWRVLESEEYLRTEDWPALRDDLIARWGAPAPEPLPYPLQSPVGTPGLPAAYLATTDRAEVLHLERPPADPSVLIDLTRTFPDIAMEDLETYRDGVRFEAVSLLPGEVEVSVMFLGRGGADTVPGGGRTVEALRAALTAALPREAETPDVGPVMFLTGSIDEARPIVIDLLASRGFEIIAQPPSPSFAQVMAFDGGETVVVTITSAEPGTIQVLLGGL
jgi:hypothetical protein